jgi:hypothetical protein
LPSRFTYKAGLSPDVLTRSTNFSASVTGGSLPINSVIILLQTRPLVLHPDRKLDRVVHCPVDVLGWVLGIVDCSQSCQTLRRKEEVLIVTQLW